MKQTITFSEFYDAFYNSSYKNNFSYDGLRALYDYLVDYETDTETELELDVVALCCDYTEYDNIEAIKEAYDLDINSEDFGTEEEYFEAIKEEIQNNTILIEAENDKVIIQNY